MKFKKHLNFKEGFRERSSRWPYVAAAKGFCSLIFSLTVGVLLAQSVSLKETNATMATVLDKLSRQTQSDLVGDIALLKRTNPVSIDVQGKDIQVVLQELSKNQPINLIYRNNTIVVRPKQSSTHSNIPSSSSDNQETYILRGQVNDEQGQPISGVNIQDMKSGRSLGRTQAQGQFSVEVSVNQELRVSIVGFESQVINVGKRREILVTMKATNTEIEETVVTGYTKARRENFTGAATTVTRKEIEKFNTGNIFSMLQALDPSFKVDERVNAGSNPNALPEINIRGISSVGEYAVNAPLVILDGFEVALSTLYDLDVNRVESISILKDASSTSLYGSRGGNGVIVIETRMPKDGKFTVTYDVKPTSSIVDLSDYNVMNAAEKLEYERLAGIYIANSTDPVWNYMQQEMYNNLYNARLRNVQSGVDTYWLKQPVRNTFSLGHSIRMEGGGNDVRYSLEGHYNDYKGVMKESGRTRGGASFNLIYRIPNVITFRNVASYQYTKAYNSPYGSFEQYTLLNPYERMKDDNGNYIVRFGELGQFYEFGEKMLFNPLYNAQQGHIDENKIHYISNNLSLEWFINANLILRGKAAISREMHNFDEYTSPFNTKFYNVTDPKLKGSYALGDSSKVAYEGRLELQYSKSFDKHQINAAAISEIRSSDITGNSHLLSGYIDDRFMTPQMALTYSPNSLPKSNSTPVRELGFIGNFYYTYDNKYNFSLTGRSDGASIYGKENRFASFWSTGLSYNVHNEPWFKNEYVNRLRLFANVGTNSTVSNFNAGMVSSAFNFLSGMFYNNQYAAVAVSQGNPNVRWPEQMQWSFGTDISLFNNLVTMNLSYYDRITNRMISKVTVAPSFGFPGGTYFANLGKASNKGFEAMANIRLLERSDTAILWYLNVGAVQNRSKLLSISNELRELNESLVSTDASGNVIKPSTYYEEGQSLTILRAIPSLGIDPANGREMYRALNGDVTYTWDARNQVVVGNKEADLYGNIGTSFNYRGLSVQVIGNYSIGGDIFNETLMNKIENNKPYVNGDKRILEERWREPGDIAKYKSISDQSTTQISNRFVQNESFLRLSAINVNYDFRSAVLERLKLQRLKLNFSMNDALRLSTVRMERGITYPYAREYNLGVMIQF